MIRKQLLLSTATICLMLAPGLIYAQSPAESKKQDTQKEHVQRNEPAKGAEPRSEGRGSEKASEQTPKTPAASSENSRAPKQDDKEHAGKDAPRQHERAGEARRDSKDAASDKPASDKSSAERSGSEKSARDSQKSDSDQTKSGAASTGRPQNPNTAGETSKTAPSTAQQGSTPANSQTSNPAASSADTNRTGNEAQRAQGTSPPATSNAHQQLSGEKQARISQTLTRTQLAAPERNLNVSISVGAELPRGVRLHRLPPEIVSIEPEYRDYEYVTTEDEIVIVDPRSHRIATTIPKDPARARAQLQGGSNSADVRGGTSTSSAAGDTGSPCRIMRRDASGQLSEVSSTTVGSSTQQRPNSLAVIVQTPDQRSTAPIQLDAQAGQIVVATQGQGDCSVTIEPQATR